MLHLSPFILSKVDGLGDVDADIQTQKAPYQDGSTYLDSTLGNRVLSLEVAIKGEDPKDVQQKRSVLSSIFNPKLGLGVVKYENETGIKEIMAVAEHVPIYPSGIGNRGSTYQRVLISLLCPDPAWYEPKIEKHTLASFVGGFSFPFSFPLSFGEVGDFLEVENKGDVDTPVFVVFQGPLKNPVLENKTIGQKITVTQEIPAGESLEINTAFGKKSVFRVLDDCSRVSAFNWVDPKSKLWHLIPGINEISYSATDEAGNAAATLSFYNRYVGV
jgi:Phage tail protein